MNKLSIAVYNPQNHLERAIQNSYHAETGEWLSSYGCQLFAKAIASLKAHNVEWLNQVSLLDQRMSYFFAKHMSGYQETMVYLTYPLFLRDILENGEIDNSLHGPVTFVTRSLAHYLFREYPVHIWLNRSMLEKLNSGKHSDQIGGMLIFDTATVSIDSSAIDKIVTLQEYGPEVDSVARKIEFTTRHHMRKAAMSSNEDHRAILPGSKVWNKKKRQIGQIDVVEPGETGKITVKYNDDTKVGFPQEDFDKEFVMCSRQKQFPVNVKGETTYLSETEIADLVRKKLQQSVTVRHLCRDFKVNPTILEELDVRITDLDQEYARTDIHTMQINASLFEEGEFFQRHFYIPVHEIVHFLCRRTNRGLAKEEFDAYFEDPEETLGFVASVAYEIEQGNDLETIYGRVFPKVSFHFHNKEDAQKFFLRLNDRAKELLS